MKEFYTLIFILLLLYIFYYKSKFFTRNIRFKMIDLKYSLPLKTNRMPYYISPNFTISHLGRL